MYPGRLASAIASRSADCAARVAARVIELSGDVASARVSERARVVLSRLAEFQDVPEVREVLDATR